MLPAGILLVTLSIPFFISPRPPTTTGIVSVFIVVVIDILQCSREVYLAEYCSSQWWDKRQRTNNYDKLPLWFIQIAAEDLRYQLKWQFKVKIIKIQKFLFAMMITPPG